MLPKKNEAHEENEALESLSEISMHIDIISIYAISTPTLVKVYY
jgi:predicted CoA-binding protein